MFLEWTCLMEIYKSVEEDEALSNTSVKGHDV
jgi:hypothetical protein